MDEVAFAIVGCGSVSDNRYFPNLDELAACGGRLAGVCDGVAERAAAKGEKFSVPHFTDLAEMLAAAEFDLLVNLTSVPNHFAVSLAALQAGKHVYTQKPMTVTVDEATQLIDQAARAGVKLVAEEARPILPAYRTMASILAAGLIGKVVWARANTCHRGPAIIDNWPTDPEWFYRKPAGPLRDVGVESLHVLTALLGPARRVTAMSGINQPEVIVRGGPNAGKRIQVDEDDITLLTLDFGDSIFAMVDVAWLNCSAGFTPELEIYGQKGVISHLTGGHQKVGPYDFDIRLYRDEPDLGIRGWEKVEPIPPISRDPSPAVAGLVHAIECIRQDTPPILSGEHARHCIEIIEKAYAAARAGATQNLETTF